MPVRPDDRGRPPDRRRVRGVPERRPSRRLLDRVHPLAGPRQTWTDPVHVYGNVSWTDKPEITSSADGKDVYVSWNGPKGGDLYVGVSHDFGRTWSQQKLSDSKRYYFAYDATTLPNGTVVFSESSLLYGAGQRLEGRSSTTRSSRATEARPGRTPWSTAGERYAMCRRGCSSDYYTGQTSVANDPSGALAFAYEGADTAGGDQRNYVRTSGDQGRTWSGRIRCRRQTRTRPGHASTSPATARPGSGRCRPRAGTRRVERVVPQLERRRDDVDCSGRGSATPPPVRSTSVRTALPRSTVTTARSP